MARYNIELSAGINAGTVKAAAEGLERIGLSAEEAEKQILDLATGTDAATEKMRAGFLNAAAGVERLLSEAESGSPRAARALNRVTLEVENLRSKVDAAQKEGAPVPPGAVALLEKYDKAIDHATERVAHMRNVADDTKDKLASMQAQTELNRGSVGDLGDVASLASPKLADLTGKGFALAGGFWAGWEAGTKLHELLSKWTDGAYDRAVTGFFERMNQSILRIPDSVAEVIPALALLKKAINFFGAEELDIEHDANYKMQKDNIEANTGKAYNDRLDFSLKETEALEARLKAEDEARRRAEEAAKKAAAEAERLAEAERRRAESIRQRIAQLGIELGYERKKLDALTAQNKLAMSSAGFRKIALQDIADEIELQAALKDAAAGSETWDIMAAVREKQNVRREAAALLEIEERTRATLEDQNARIVEQAALRRATGDDAAVIAFERNARVGRPTPAQLELAGAYKAQLKTVGDEWIKEIQRIRSVTRTESGKWGLTVQESQELIGRIYMQKTAEIVGGLQGLLSSIAGIVGNRGGIQTAQRILGSAQQVLGIYNQVGSLATTMGASSAMSGAAAAAGATFAVFAIIYQGVSAYLQKQRLAKYGTAMSLQVTHGDYGVDQLSFEAGKYLNALRDTIDGIAASIHATVEEMPKISIRMRNDGKKFEASVGGVFVGLFNSIEDATSAALAQVMTQIQFRGANPIVEQVLANSMNSTMEQLNRNLMMAQELSDVALTQTEQTMRAINERTMQYMAFIRENRITDPSAVTNLATLTTGSYNQVRDQITGHQRSQAEQLAFQRQEGVLFNARLEMAKADFRLMRIRLEEERRVLEWRGRFTRANIDIDRGDMRIDETMLEIESEFLKIRKDQVETRANLYQIELDAMDASLRAIDEMLAALDRVKPIDPNEIKLPGRGGRGGQGNPLADAIAQVQLQRLGEYGRQIHDLTSKWDELARGMGKGDDALRRAAKTRDEAIKAAHGNADAIKKANEEYRRAVQHVNRNRESLEAANRARAEELGLLRQRAQQDLIRPYAGRLGDRGPEAQQLADIQRSYADLRASRGPLNLALWQINAAEKERTRQLGLETQAALGIVEAGIAQEFGAMAQKLAFLRDHAQEFGYAVDQVNRIAAEVEQGVFLSLAEKMAARIGDEKLLAELAEMRYDAEKLGYRLSIEKAKAENLITEATYRRLMEILGRLPEDLPAAGPTATAAEATADYVARRQEDAARDIAEAARQFGDWVKRLQGVNDSILYGDQGLLSPEAQMEEMLARVRSAGAGALHGDLAAMGLLPDLENQLIQIVRRNSASSEPGANVLNEILRLNNQLGGLSGLNRGAGYYDQRYGFTPPQIAPIGAYRYDQAASSAPPAGLYQDFTAALMQSASGLGREIALLWGEVAQVKQALVEIKAQMVADSSLRRREVSAAESVLRLVR